MKLTSSNLNSNSNNSSKIILNNPGINNSINTTPLKIKPKTTQKNSSQKSLKSIPISSNFSTNFTNNFDNSSSNLHKKSFSSNFFSTGKDWVSNNMSNTNTKFNSTFYSNFSNFSNLNNYSINTSSCFKYYNPNYKKNIFPRDLLERRSKLLDITRSSISILKSNRDIDKNVKKLKDLKSNLFLDIAKPRYKGRNVKISNDEREDLDESSGDFLKEYEETLRMEKSILVRKDEKDVVENNFNLSRNFSNDVENLKLNKKIRKDSEKKVNFSLIKKNSNSISNSNSNSHKLSLSHPKPHPFHKTKAFILKFLPKDKNENFKKLQENENLTNFIREFKNLRLVHSLEGTKELVGDSEKIDLKNIKFQNLAKTYKDNVLPYMKYLNTKNLRKYDYLVKIDTGDIIKDELKSNFMGKLIPGNFLNFSNDSTVNKIKVLQPRYVKRNFKDKRNIFEFQKPKSPKTRVKA